MVECVDERPNLRRCDHQVPARGFSSVDRGGQHMQITGIRQDRPSNSVLVAAHVGIRQLAAHNAKGSLQSLARDPSVRHQVGRPFFMDRLRPAHVYQALDAELDQQVAESGMGREG